MNFLKLTRMSTDVSVLVNLDHVQAVSPNGDGSTVQMVGGLTVYVSESPQYIESYAYGMSAFVDHDLGSTYGEAFRVDPAALAVVD